MVATVGRSGARQEGRKAYRQARERGEGVEGPGKLSGEGKSAETRARQGAGTAGPRAGGRVCMPPGELELAEGDSG